MGKSPGKLHIKEQGKTWASALLWVALVLLVAGAVGFGVYAWQQNKINDLKRQVEDLQSQQNTDQQTDQTTTDNQTATPTTEFTSQKGEKVFVTSPASNTVVTSPLTVTGKVKGSWSFEATFPIELLDKNKKNIAQSYATLEGDWMTSNYVPFKGTIEFTKPAGMTDGFLILRKANASDLPQHDDFVEIPVKF